jgi:hypothetical protein
MAIRHAVSGEIRSPLTFSSYSRGRGTYNFGLRRNKTIGSRLPVTRPLRPVGVMPRAAYSALAFASTIACSEDLRQDTGCLDLAMPGHGPTPSLLSDHRLRATGSHKLPGIVRQQHDHRGKMLKRLSLSSPELSSAHRRGYAQAKQFSLLTNGRCHGRRTNGYAFRHKENYNF